MKDALIQEPADSAPVENDPTSSHMHKLLTCLVIIIFNGIPYSTGNPSWSTELLIIAAIIGVNSLWKSGHEIENPGPD